MPGLIHVCAWWEGNNGIIRNNPKREFDDRYHEAA